MKNVSQEFKDFSNKTCIVTVTYGDRFPYLERVVKAGLNAGVSKIIVVDNASVQETVSGLYEIQAQSKGKIDILRFEKNLGSAGGYKAGLEQALTYEHLEFVWLLDDDNEPKPDSLARIWDAFRLLGAIPDNAFLSLRRDRIEYVQASIEGARVTWRCTAFLGFHFLDLPRKIFNRFSLKARNNKPKELFPLVPVEIAPYGGFFFHLQWLSKAGLPNEGFFLYGDDHEFSNRIFKAGANIYLCESSEVVDIDTSWIHQPVASRPWMNPEIDDKRIYYSMRNSVYRSVKAQGKSFLIRLQYLSNIAIYLTFLFGIGLIKHKKIAFLIQRAKIFEKAIKDGFQGRLGEI